MTIQHFKDDISKDTNVCGYNTYLSNGQGCGTIWFRDVPTARKALKKDGIKTGKDFADCNYCDCYYSPDDDKWNKYKPHICEPEKKEYALSFEVNKGRTKQPTGKIYKEETPIEPVTNKEAEYKSKIEYNRFYYGINSIKDENDTNIEHLIFTKVLEVALLDDSITTFMKWRITTKKHDYTIHIVPVGKKEEINDFDDLFIPFHEFLMEAKYKNIWVGSQFECLDVYWEQGNWHWDSKKYYYNKRKK